MSDNDTLRENVSASYAEAVETPAAGCCGSSATVKGVAARAAGYTDDELAGLPEDARVNSFGCGNPVAFSDVRPGDVVLDLGSGAGIDLLLAARRVGPEGRVIGVDMTDAMIAHAQRNITAAGLGNVELRKGLIEELPVEDGSVDWVISNCVINLSPEKERVFTEIARVLKAGGRMVVSDIMVEDLPEWARESAELYCSCVAGAIPEGEYVAGLEAAGLTGVAVTERLVYDAAQLAELVRSELDGDAESAASACCGGTIAALIDRAADELQGKVWSARVVARKPAAGTDRAS